MNILQEPRHFRKTSIERKGNIIRLLAVVGNSAPTIGEIHMQMPDLQRDMIKKLVNELEEEGKLIRGGVTNYPTFRKANDL